MQAKHSTFNRPYTVAEQRGLSEVTSLMVEIYKKIGLPIIQTAQAGNNSHSLNELDGITQIGSIKEPSMLHTHIWGRGDPKWEYLSGIPLDGPKPGEMFDMMAKTPSVIGNEKKIPWDKTQLKNGLHIIKNSLQTYIGSAEFIEEFAPSLRVRIFEPTSEGKIMDASQEAVYSFFEVARKAATTEMLEAVAHEQSELQI